MQRYPDIAEEGRGRDWAYAGWYAEMLGVAERGCLTVAYADWYPGDEPEEGWLAVVCWEDAPRELVWARVPLPPPAEELSRGP